MNFIYKKLEWCMSGEHYILFMESKFAVVVEIQQLEDFWNSSSYGRKIDMNFIYKKLEWHMSGEHYHLFMESKFAVVMENQQ